MKDRFDWSKLEEDYKELRSTIKVAEKYGCSHEAVSYQLGKRNIQVIDHKIRIENIKELYETHKSVIKVAKLIGCSDTTIKERLREIGYQFSHDNKGLALEVGVGRYGERISLEILKDSKDMAGQKVNFPYDISWNGLKIDVKTSRLRKRKNRKNHYSFSTKNQSCDYYLLIALDKSDLPIKIWLVPRNIIKTYGICIPCDFSGKWAKYEMETDEIELRKAAENAKRIG